MSATSCVLRRFTWREDASTITNKNGYTENPPKSPVKSFVNTLGFSSVSKDFFARSSHLYVTALTYCLKIINYSSSLSL